MSREEQYGGVWQLIQSEDVDLPDLERRMSEAIGRASGSTVGTVRVVKVAPSSIEVTMEVYPDRIDLTALEPAGRGHELYGQAVERADAEIAVALGVEPCSPTRST